MIDWDQNYRMVTTKYSTSLPCHCSSLIDDPQQCPQLTDFTAEDLKKYELNAPKVIVVGLTSAGKSSLLERVIGHRVFPVKDTVCTRRPFAVHLRNDPQAEGTTLRFANSSIPTSTTNGVPSTAAPGGPVGENKHHNSTPTSSSTERGEGQPMLQPSGPVFSLPAQIEAVRAQIEHEQKSDIEEVVFSSREIHAEVRSRSNETFTFTDLPGKEHTLHHTIMGHTVLMRRNQ
jgi:hypothetical protein